jgi:starch synthase
MDVLHLAAECAPLAKVGGLGDVLGALPAATAAHGIRASVLIPFYGGPEGAVAAAAGPIARVHDGRARYDGAPFSYRVWCADASPVGVPVYLLEQAECFGRPGVYVGRDGEPLAPERFLLFQRAALDWLASAGAPRFDLLHVHDHHAGLVPVLLANDPETVALRGLPTVATVHSADHQGTAPWRLWEAFNVPVRSVEGLLVDDDLNPLKAAVTWATAVTTPSPSYAEELATDPNVSRGLVETFRRARPKTVGILNGVDAARWNPATDPLLPHRYSASDLSGKAATKAAVCAELGLDAARPLVASVGRLMPEKGVELIPEGVERTLHQTEASFAVLGAGDSESETTLRGLAGLMAREGYGDRVAVHLGFDEGLAHRLFAAADVFALPAHHEPGGLSARYAMRYGTPPVVRAVGGMRDTVTPWDGAAGTGFTFDAFTSEAFVAALRAALAVHADPDAWATIVQAGMATDRSWDAAAAEYAGLYRRLEARKRVGA